MRSAPRAVLSVLIMVAFVWCVSPATAQGDASGGVQAPSEQLAGGSEYGVPAQTVEAQRPVASRLTLPATAVSGRPPRLLLRIDEAGVGTVSVQVTVLDLATHRPAITVVMGWVHTGRTVVLNWPRDGTLSPGSYEVIVNARDHHGGTLLRSGHYRGVASLTITAPVKVQPKAAPSPVPAPVTPPGVPTPAESVADGAVFPVVGPHNFGGPENIFGAPRDGYLHQGQDVLTAEGTPVVVPLAGTILTTSYQAEGAGYYAVEQTGIGFDFMFAHCQAGSLAVSTGQSVAAGQALCTAGQTGDATAPHLDFEIWIGGWQAPGGYPINPLPYLEAWEHAGTAA